MAVVNFQSQWWCANRSGGVPAAVVVCQSQRLGSSRSGGVPTAVEGFQLQ